MNLTRFEREIKELGSSYNVLGDFENEQIEKISNNKYIDKKDNKDNNEVITFSEALTLIWSTTKPKEIVNSLGY